MVRGRASCFLSQTSRGWTRTPGHINGLVNQLCHEQEGFLGDVVGGLLGESEEEYEEEAHDHELEGEEEGFLGDVVGGLLGESEEEYEEEEELEAEEEEEEEEEEE